MSFFYALLSLEERLSLALLRVSLVLYHYPLEFLLKIHAAGPFAEYRVLFLEGQGHLPLQHPGANMLHKEIVLFEFGVSQLHFLFLQPLPHGQLSLHVFNSAFLPICEVYRVQILFFLRLYGLVQ